MREPCMTCGRRIKEQGAVFCYRPNSTLRWFGCKRCHRAERREVSSGQRPAPAK